MTIQTSNIVDGNGIIQLSSKIDDYKHPIVDENGIELHNFHPDIDDYKHPIMEGNGII